MGKLNASEINALARSANVSIETARAWLDGERVQPEIATKLTRVYRALSFGGPPPRVTGNTAPEVLGLSTAPLVQA